MFKVIFKIRPAFFMSYNMCFPIKEGDLETTIPASYKVFILLWVSPLFAFLNYGSSMPHSTLRGSSQTFNKAYNKFVLFTIFFLPICS